MGSRNDPLPDTRAARALKPASDIDAVASLLNRAKRVVVLTGAGVSAESGVPTFRDAMDGLWAKFDPQELATPEAFARNPQLVAKWYDERRIRCMSVRPNPGHDALFRLESILQDVERSFALITQNVDRLHQLAGSRNVIELHGNIFTWRCTRCGAEREERGAAFTEHPPRCDCGGTRRPGVVWFGELLDERVLDNAHRALAHCDLFFSIGTSAVVEPAASFAHMAREASATTVEINKDPTPISGAVDYSLMGPSGVLLPQIVGKVEA